MFSNQTWEHMTPEQRKRNGRVIALVLALSIVVSLTVLTYAFLQKGNAEKTRAEFEQSAQLLEFELRACREEALKAEERARAQQVQSHRAMVAAMAAEAALKK